jgi:hypothetical protein
MRLRRFAFAGALAGGVAVIMALTVNASAAGSITFGTTANWDTWANATATVTLTAGTNTIRVTSTTANGGPNLDWVEVS